MSIDKAVDFSVVLFVTYGDGDGRQLLFIKNTVGELRLPSGPNLEFETQAIETAARIARQHLGLTHGPHVKVREIGKTQRSIKKHAKKRRLKSVLYTYPVHLIQVHIEVDALINRSDFLQEIGVEKIESYSLPGSLSARHMIPYHRNLILETSEALISRW